MAKERAPRQRSQESRPQALASVHLAALIESTTELIWSVDLDLRLVSFNKVLSNAFARSYGVKIAAGMTPRDLLPPEKTAFFPPLYEKALREGPCSAEYRVADGRYFEMTFSPMIQDGRKVGVSVFGKDVTRQKSAEEALRKTAEQYREIFEFAPEAIFRNTKEGKTLAINPAAARLLGYDSPGEAIAVLNDWSQQVWLDPAERAAFVKILERQGEASSGPRQFKRKDGTLFWAIMTARKICGPGGKTLYFQGFLEDITQRKVAEERLAAAHERVRLSEERYRQIFQSSLVMAAVTQLEDGVIVDVNNTFLDTMEFKSTEVIGHTTFALNFWADLRDRDRFVELLQQHAEFRNFKTGLRKKSGAVIPVLVSASLIQIGGVACALSVMRDVSEIAAAEEALRKTEEKFREIFEEAPEGIYQTTKEGKSLALNPAGAKLLGFPSSGDAVTSITDSAHDVWLNPEERARYMQILEEQGKIRDFSCQFRRTDGTPIWVSLTARRVCGQDGQTIYYQGFIEDITEQKALAADLKARVRELQVLSEMNSALLHARTEEELLTEYCRILVEVAGYRMAWVGFAEEGPEKRILPVAHYGHEEGYLELLNVTWADTEHGQGPTGRCIRTGEICVSRDLATDPVIAPWREEALNRGYMSSIAIPFRQFEGEMACLTAYGVRVSRWSDPERQLMDQVASALGFGIATLRTALAKTQYQEDLRKSLEQTVEVIAETMDHRDPYTAGHERKVADLCAAIARKLGLSAARTQGLRLAAIIHDLGKIGVPAEILTKPGRLTEIQFALIKEHVQLGYNIVKNVQFPWPIAQMILQHHERLDGSGYPQGLKADEIYLESRILAVADVVEAMSSHRPYRASKGIDAALDEILSKRGILYDPEVVNACVDLFRSDGYQFPSQ